MVYVGSFDNNLYAVNASTGKELWACKTGAAVGASPAVANGMVVESSHDHSIYAFHL